ncbi:MAG: ATP-binding protein [Pikeienuella sp.]
MSRRVWRITKTLSEVADAAAAAEASCIEWGADESQALRIGLALDELAANALLHGAQTEVPATISAELWADNGMLRLRIDATGPGFDPRQRRDAEPNADIAIGGRGIALVLAFADELSYRREGQRNITDFAVRSVGSEP